MSVNLVDLIKNVVSHVAALWSNSFWLTAGNFKGRKMCIRQMMDSKRSRSFVKWPLDY